MATLAVRGQRPVGVRTPLRGAPCLASPSRRQAPRARTCGVVARAERRDGGGFVTGFVLGGVVFGALGFLFAPQISAALLSEDQRLKLPRFLEEEERTPEETKQDLADKIAQLNSAIDDVSAQLRAQDAAAAAVGGVGVNAS